MNTIWTSEQADIKFSKMIRERDPICVRCHRRPTTDCSHFYERGHSATRYDVNNADGLCRICHQIWEGRKNGYIEYKQTKLGFKTYERLTQMRYSTMQRTEAIIRFMRFYETWQKRKSNSIQSGRY